MANQYWGTDWLVHNSVRRYPLADNATAVDQTGEFTIPQDFLVGMDVPVHAGHDVDPAKFYVKHIGVFAGGYSIVVGYDGANGPVDVATALVAAQGHERYSTYTLGGKGDFDDTLGKVVVGKLDNIDQQPEGFYTFDLDKTRLSPDAVRPHIRGVSSIRLVNGNDVSERFVGDIELEAGTNMQLVPVIVGGKDPKIRLSAVEGEGLSEDCVCEGQEKPECIRRINGIPPTPAGDFALIGSTCLEFESIDRGLRIKDTCSQPCCGCEELEQVTRDMERLRDQSTTFENFLSRLESQVTQLNQTVLGSKLSDQPCGQPCS
jgi:hypothetical protein